MKSIDGTTFYAKILLFGEYSIILGGKAIIAPWKQYAGCLQFPPADGTITAEHTDSNKNLDKYLLFLKTRELANTLPIGMDTQKLEDDIAKGLFFDSTIPQGYGAGSSGALIAALFTHYAQTDISPVSSHDKEYLSTLREQFALMESFFHGSSSGLDPLSSFLGKPFIVDDEKEILIRHKPLFPEALNITIFLIDTRQQGNTKPLVRWFREQASEGYLNTSLLKILNDETVNSLLRSERSMFFNFIDQLSLFQLANMQPMVPRTMHNFWQDGIITGDFTLKLCGSGGGGFLLGFTRDMTKVRDHCRNYQIPDQQLTELPPAAI